MAWGWFGGGSARAPIDEQERDRRSWLEDHGITPMNRSTRLWDMEVTAHRWFPHRIERVGSKDMAQHALNQQRGGEKIDPIKWEGSRNSATGRAYDWCYCIEAVNEEVDGRTACVCQCVDCKEHNHWRKRHHASVIRAEMIRYKKAQETRRKRFWRRVDDWVWLYHAWKRGDAEWRWEVLNRTPELTDEDAPTVPLNQEEQDG